MDLTSMDDKLYYVESPDGKVLGPMNMIQILEGIAAGAILDTARICEVGRQEWVELSEVAYTHHEEPAPERRVPAAEVPGHRVPNPAAASFTDPDDFDLGDLEPMGAEAELESFEIPDPVTPVPTPEPSMLQTPVPEAGVSEAPEPAETPIAFEALPDAIEPFEPTPIPDATPTPIEAWGSPTPIAREDMPQDLATSGSPEDALRDLPTEIPVEALQELPASAYPEDVARELPASAYPEDTSHGLPASAFPEDGTRELPASAYPADGPGAGASDFQLDMPGAEDEELEEVVAAAEAPRSRKWILPVAVLVALPVLAGVYHLAGGPSPFSKPADETAGSEAAKAAPGSETPSVADEGWAALQEGRLQGAMNRFEAAIAENPDDARAHHGRGLAALRLGNPKDAIRSLERSLELDAASAQVRTDLGRAQLASGQPELALASAQRVLDLDPAWAAARRLLGETQLASGDAGSAVVTLTEHLRSRPDDAAARRALANAYAETGRLEPALDEMQAYLAKHPEDREADSQRLEWFRATGRLAEAALIYADLAAKRPDDAHVQYLAGLAHAESDEGIAYLERSLALDGSNDDARSALADLRRRLGRSARSTPRATAPKPAPTLIETASPDPVDVAEAPAQTVVETVPEVVAPEPEPAATVTLAARIQEIRDAVSGGSVAAAREALEQAQRENAGDADARRNLALWAGILDFHEGQLDAAVAAFDRLDPAASYAVAGFGPGAIQNWQARAHLAKGDVRGAIAALDGVGRDDADEYATARLWEGVALASLGMTELAERTWQRVPEDVGSAVTTSGQGAVKSAEFLAGAISAKDYRTAVASIDGFENDMHFVLGFQARRADELEVARGHFRKVIESSRGHEFPYDLAQAEVAGTGLTGEWPAE
jgi:tetratricopeptide (TPR) repeat protein